MVWRDSALSSVPGMPIGLYKPISLGVRLRGRESGDKIRSQKVTIERLETTLPALGRDGESYGGEHQQVN